MSRRFRGAAVLALSALILTAGCAHLPRPAESQAGLARIAEFRAALAPRYEVVSSVVFKFGFVTLASLSAASVDTEAERLSVAGVTPFGITLFKVVSERGRIVESFFAPDLAKHGDAAQAVADSIRDLYFDLAPADLAVVAVEGSRIVARTPERGGRRIETVFADGGGTLAEKRLLDRGEAVWSAEYAQWTADAEGHRYPAAIHYTHHRYRYELEISVKEERPR